MSRAANSAGEVSVKATNYSMLEYEQPMGVLWPAKLHDDRFGKAARSAYSTHTIHGKKIRGVLKSSELGNPDGTFKLSSKSGTGAELRAIHNAENDLENETERIHEAAQKRMRLSVRPLSKDPETLRMVGVASAEGDDDSDSVA